MIHFIKQAAGEIGFDACGIAKADKLTEEAVYLKEWLDQSFHGKMDYLERNFEKRVDPRLLVPGVQSIIVVLFNYYPVEFQKNCELKISKYAYSAVDYHTILKEKLNLLRNAIIDQFGETCFSKEHQHIFVDSAPVLERSWAQRAGLGWIGRNKQLISPKIGSNCFIGILMMNKTLGEYDKPIPDRCGNCSLCLDACPTKALSKKYLDASRCISYLTIELKDSIPDEFHPLLSNNIIGCDICMDVCPWNRKKAIPHQHNELTPPDELLEWNSEQWEKMSKEEFNHIFKKSAIKRAGFEKIMQNIKIIKNEKSVNKSK